MAILRLDKGNWQTYFDRVSKKLAGMHAEIEIEIDSLSIGSQIEVEWLPLFGIVYDPKSDMIEIVLEGLDHMIRRPRELYVDHDGVQLTSLEVIDSDDVRQVVKLRAPLELPPP
jgi:hypothetical protein